MIRGIPGGRAPIADIAREAYFVLCKAVGLLLYGSRATPLFATFLGSSVVEHSTVNRMAAGSNPARGANQVRRFSHLRRIHAAPLVAPAWATCERDYKTRPSPAQCAYEDSGARGASVSVDEKQFVICEFRGNIRTLVRSSA